MSTGYGWEGIRQVCATLLGARHVPERLCCGSVYRPTWGAIQVLNLYPFFSRATFKKFECMVTIVPVYGIRMDSVNIAVHLSSTI